MTSAALILLVLAGLALPFGIEAMRRPMDETARAGAPGRFARLSSGITHYRWTGPENGAVVVCIHGLTTPSFVWQGVAAGLAAAGFRVLTYDLYGRGYSDRPAGTQDSAFFLRQIDDLLADQQVTEPVALVGYSMGGAIATAFAARDPDRVRAVVLLAPAGMQAVGTGGMRNLIGVPLLGRWLMLLHYPSMLRRGLRAEAGMPGSVPGIGALQAAELGFCGFLPAVHESLVAMLSGDLRAEHESLHRAGLPMLAVWGAADTVIPLAAKDTLSAWNPDARHIVLEGAGHGLTYTHTDAWLPQVAAFLTDRA